MRTGIEAEYGAVGRVTSGEGGGGWKKEKEQMEAAVPDPISGTKRGKRIEVPTQHRTKVPRYRDRFLWY